MTRIRSYTHELGLDRRVWREHAAPSTTENAGPPARKPCPRCGDLRPGLAQFCHTCGQDLRPGAVVLPASTSNAASEARRGPRPPLLVILPTLGVLLVAVVLGARIAFQSASLGNGNLLQNPSLETASGGTPTCGLLSGYGTNTYSWTRTNDAHDGSFAENLTVSSYTSGDRKMVSAQDSGTCAPSVTAGRTYTVTVWYKSTVQPYIFAYYRNSSGSWVYWASSAKLAKTASWSQASWMTPAVPTGATHISVGMGLNRVGSLTMDDFGLVAGP